MRVTQAMSNDEHLASAFKIDEIEKIHQAISPFPLGSQISLAKIVNGRTYTYGLQKGDDGV